MPWRDLKERHRGECNIRHGEVDTLQIVMWFNRSKFKVLKTLMHHDESWSLTTWL